MGRRSRRILTGLGIVIVALGVVYALLLIRATAKLQRAYTALEADGRPMRTADVIPAKVPDSENAAVPYQNAILMLKGHPASDKSVFERLTAHATKERQAAEKEWLDHDVVTRALALVEEGTNRPTCQIERDNDKLWNSIDDSLVDDWRKLALILTSKADYEAQAGNLTKAWELALTQLRFADSLRTDPASGTQITRMSLAVRASRMMRQLCETALPPPDIGEAIEDFLCRQDDLEPLIQAIDGERLLIGEWFFNLPRKELDKILWKERGDDGVAPPGVQKAMHRLSFTVTAFRPRLVADHAAYLQLMRKRVQLLHGPYRNREQTDKFLQHSHWNFLTHKLTWFSGMDQWFYSRFVADLRVTRAGLALLQYRQTHGAFPENLEVLGLGQLVDPYTDQPLHYRAEGDGFVVYSVGDDLKDNGGAPPRRRTDSDPRRKPIESDQVWIFPNPEHQLAEEVEQQ